MLNSLMPITRICHLNIVPTGETEISPSVLLEPERLEGSSAEGRMTLHAANRFRPSPIVENPQRPILKEVRMKTPASVMLKVRGGCITICTRLPHLEARSRTESCPGRERAC
jgi:hypothetical protein